MPRFRIKCASVITIWHEALVTIDARSRRAALAEAAAMDERGACPWQETAGDQNDPTTYTVVDRQD